MVKWFLKFLLACIDKNSYFYAPFIFFNIIEDDFHELISKLLDVQFILDNNSLSLKFKEDLEF